MPANVPIFGIIPKHTVLINVNEKNIQNENPTKEKEKFNINELTSESNSCSSEKEC